MTTPELLLGLAAVAVPTLAVVVSMVVNARATRENSRAHDGIVQRIDGVDQRSLARDEALRLGVESIARDVSFMAGRQAERDRRPTYEGSRIQSHAAEPKPQYGIGNAPDVPDTPDRGD